MTWKTDDGVAIDTGLRIVITTDASGNRYYEMVDEDSRIRFYPAEIIPMIQALYALEAMPMPTPVEF